MKYQKPKTPANMHHKITATISALDQITNKPVNVKSTLKQRLHELSQVYLLLEELKTLQKPNLGSQITDFDKFYEWLTKEGFDESKARVEIKSAVNAGNGLFARSKIKKQDLLISVPEKFMLSTNTANKSEKLANFIQSDPLVKQLPSTALALHLIEEFRKGEKSFWKPYIDIIPRNFTTPLHFTPGEVDCMKGSAIQENIARYVISVVRQYCYLFHKLNNAGISLMSYEEFKWAVSVVMTRQNKIPIGGTDEAPIFGLALIPIWDMANHRNEGEITTFFDASKKSTDCFSMDGFEEGEQVFIFYGPRTNIDLLMYSGFIPKTNSYDCFSLPLCLSQNDPLYKRKLALLKMVNCGFENKRAFFLYKGPFATNNPELLYFVRVHCMTESNLDYIDSDKFENDQRRADTLAGPTPFEAGNEKEALEFLKLRCQLMLKRYTVNFEEKDAEKLFDNYGEYVVEVGGVNIALAHQLCFSEQQQLKEAIKSISLLLEQL